MHIFVGLILLQLFREASAFKSLLSPRFHTPSQGTTISLDWDVKKPFRPSLLQEDAIGLKTSIEWTTNGRTPPCRIALLSARTTNQEDNPPPPLNLPQIPPVAILITASVAYWYFLVFGAAAHENGLWVPDFIPLVPGWPPSDADLAPVIEDSVHFFYISDALGVLSSPGAEVVGDAVGQTPPPPPPLRLAFFNLAEAWVFLFLPVLLTDRKRLPVPIVIGMWIGALGLTNAFLMPYLAFREVLGTASDTDDGEGDSVDDAAQSILSSAFGVVATAVVGWAAFQVGTESTVEQWTEFGNLVVSDRTYLAFAIDLVIFAVTQKFLLAQVSPTSNKPIYGVPFVGLIAWLFGE